MDAAPSGGVDAGSRVPIERDSRVNVELGLSRYCAEHPNAADTVEGIQRWWLVDLVCLREDIELALGELVKRGVLAERRLPCGETVYFCRGGCACSPV